MKYLFVIALFFLASASSAENVKGKSADFPGLDAESIDQVIKPSKVDGDVFTPYAVWYVKNGDFAPSCALVDGKNKSLKFEIVAPSDGQYENCHQTLKEPLIVKINKSNYAVYSYVTEETRSELTNNVKVVLLKSDAFYLCKEDSEISGYIETHNKKRNADIVALATAALTKFGCTAVPVAP